MQSFRQFPLIDPDIPGELGGNFPDWDRAVELFHERWRAFASGATGPSSRNLADSPSRMKARIRLACADAAIGDHRVGTPR